MDYLATCSSGLLKQINEDGVLISHMESLSWSFFQQTSYKGFLNSPTTSSEACLSGVERQRFQWFTSPNFFTHGQQK